MKSTCAECANEKQNSLKIIYRNFVAFVVILVFLLPPCDSDTLWLYVWMLLLMMIINIRESWFNKKPKTFATNFSHQIPCISIGLQLTTIGHDKLNEMCQRNRINQSTRIFYTVQILNIDDTVVLNFFLHNLVGDCPTEREHKAGQFFKSGDICVTIE